MQGQAYFPDTLIFRLSLDDKGGKTGLKRLLREPGSPSKPIGAGEEGREAVTGTEAPITWPYQESRAIGAALSRPAHG